MSYEQNKRADERNLGVKADNTVLTQIMPIKSAYTFRNSILLW